MWKKKDCSKGLQFLLKVLETKMFLILSAKWPENLAEKETRMSSEFLYRTMFTRKNHEKKKFFFLRGAASALLGENLEVLKMKMWALHHPCFSLYTSILFQ